MATIAIGDIHGHYEALADLLNRLQGAVTGDDTLVFLGDYIDRGARSRECIDAILALQASSPARVVCLRGNHEDWMLRSLRDHCCHSWLLGMDGVVTIRSYSEEAAALITDAMAERRHDLYGEGCPLPYEVFFDRLPAAHRAFFEDLQTSHRTRDCLCAHAGVNPSIRRLKDQPARDLIWGTTAFPKDYTGRDCIVYGHRNNAIIGADGWPHPHLVGRTFGIDTIKHGVLTAIRMPGAEVIQSRRHAPLHGA